MTPETLVNVLEAAMLAAGRALSLDDFLALFTGSTDAPDRSELRNALAQLGDSLNGRGIELVEVASGYRLQVREQYSSWLGGLFSERPPRYSRALLETLALVAYRQPITRGEIEAVRGVAVSSNIVKTLMEREWVRVLGHREVPGRPALYGTTREFLDHFGLKSLEGLPPLADIRDLDQVAPDLFAPAPSDAGGDETAVGDGVDAASAHLQGSAGSDELEGPGAAGELNGEGAVDGEDERDVEISSAPDASLQLGGARGDADDLQRSADTHEADAASDGYGNADTDGDRNADGDADGDRNADGDADGDGDGDADADGDSNADVDADGDSNADADADADGDSNGDRNLDVDADGGSNADVDVDADGDSNADGDADAASYGEDDSGYEERSVDDDDDDAGEDIEVLEPSAPTRPTESVAAADDAANGEADERT